jgi:tetratricopeptide (TPR) repeat protein
MTVTLPKAIPLSRSRALYWLGREPSSSPVIETLDISDLQARLAPMGSEDWYRHTDWDAEIEAAFEARLARTRTQKAQYLRIQGAMLKDSHPAVALRLLERCIAERDAAHVAHAHLNAAHAHYMLGDVDSALDSLEAAMEQQQREPMFRTSAAFDYAMLVALHCLPDRYDRAMGALEGADDAFFATMLFQARTAQAMIYAARGRKDEARQAAREALAAADIREGWIPGYPDVGVLPEGDSPVFDRLRALA